jgi:SAM-dependent methyltransferase
MKLLNQSALESSSVVANTTMNRERRCTGSNSYARELQFDPLEFLRERLASQAQATWLDLCCGSGKALIEAAQSLQSEAEALRLKIIGLDLVSFFAPLPTELAFLQLQEASVESWEPDCQFDLITCVHGLHYLGDKLRLRARVASWLKPDGIFLANLDHRNLRLVGDSANRKIRRELRANGFAYDARKHLLSCHGGREVRFSFTYLGADDEAGPNYTGQPVVNSHYA